MVTRRSFIKKASGTALAFGTGIIAAQAYTNQWGTNPAGSGGVTWSCGASQGCTNRDSGTQFPGSEEGAYCQGICSNGTISKTANMKCPSAGIPTGVTWCQWT